MCSKATRSSSATVANPTKVIHQVAPWGPVVESKWRAEMTVQPRPSAHVHQLGLPEEVVRLGRPRLPLSRLPRGAIGLYP